MPDYGRASSSSAASSHSGNSSMSSTSPMDSHFRLDSFAPHHGMNQPDSLLFSSINNGFTPQNGAGSQALDPSFLLQQITELTRQLDAVNGQLKERTASYRDLLEKLEQYQTMTALGPPLAPTPNRDDYPGVSNWQPPTNVDDQPRYEFIVAADDNFVGKARTVVMSEHGKWCFQELHRRGLAASTWGAHGLLAIVLFINAMEAAFPELALCADHWKAKAFARKLYPDWVSRRGKEVSNRAKSKRKTTASALGAGDDSDAPGNGQPAAKRLRGPDQSLAVALVPRQPVQPPAPPSASIAPVAKNNTLALATLKPRAKNPTIKLAQPMSRAALKAAEAEPSLQPSTSSTTAQPSANATCVATVPAPPLDSELPPSPPQDSLTAPPAPMQPGLQLPASPPIAAPVAPQQTSLVPAPLVPPPPPPVKMFRVFRNYTQPEHVLRCEWADRPSKPERTTPRWEAYLASAEGQAALKSIQERVTAK